MIVLSWQAALICVAITAFIGWDVGNVRGYRRGHDDGYDLAKRLNAKKDS